MASETCVLLNGKHLDELIVRINKDLNLLFTYIQANKLSLGGLKTYYIIFHRDKIKLTSYYSNLVMGGSIITATKGIKYIGTIIDK